MARKGLELLEKAIENKDWALIAEAYLSLSKEKITTIKSAPKIIKEPKSQKKRVTSKTKTKSIGDKVVLDDKESNIKITPAAPKVAGPVSGKNVKMTFITSNEDAKESKINQKYFKSNRGENKRDPYKAKMVKCNTCSDKFDFNQEYPMGLLDKESAILCNKCKRRN